MDAIAAVERRLQEDVEDGPAWTLKRLLYQDVTEADYDAAAGDPSQVAAGFDHGYAQQLGLALINDPQRWRRGAEYLRLAARGLPLLGPSLFSQIAQAYGRNGEPEPAWHYYRLARQAGLSVGVKNLSGEDRALYFAVLKLLADDAHARGDLRAAIENYQLATEDERSGVETLRTLATLYEQNGDPLNALRVTEKALVYSARDPDLLQRKDRYYYSVMPDQLRGNPDAIPGGFDLDYCLRKARTILAGRDLDLDMLDWGQHLADLALAV
jgi:hypothetical protein